MKRSRRRKRVVHERSGRSGAARLLGLAVMVASAVTGGLLGARGFEPLAARLCPQCLSVERLSVIGARHAPAVELIAKLGVPAGTPVLSLDRAELARRIERHPWVRSAEVALVRPGLLVARVTERDAAAVTRLGSPPTFWLVDGDGTPFAPVSPGRAGEHVAIAGPADAEPGAADGRLREGVRIARALARHGIAAALEVEVAGAPSAELPAVRLASGPRVLLGPGDLDDKLSRLTALLSAEIEEAKRAAVIDLRFGDRMVLRGGPPEGSGEATEAGGRPSPSWTGSAG